MGRSLGRNLLLSDLVPGRIYRSPTGRLCTLKHPALRGPQRYMLVFSYLSKAGEETDDQFQVNASNSRLIAAMQEIAR